VGFSVGMGVEVAMLVGEGGSAHLLKGGFVIHPASSTATITMHKRLPTHTRFVQ